MVLQKRTPALHLALEVVRRSPRLHPVVANNLAHAYALEAAQYVRLRPSRNDDARVERGNSSRSWRVVSRIAALLGYGTMGASVPSKPNASNTLDQANCLRRF